MKVKRLGLLGGIALFGFAVPAMASGLHGPPSPRPNSTTNGTPPTWTQPTTWTAPTTT